MLLALTLSTAPALADGATVDLTPSFGVFNPTQDNLDEVLPGLGSVTAKHGSGNAFGGRLDVWLNPHFALEGTGYLTTGSSLDGEAFGVPGSVDASFFYGSGRALVGVGTTAKLLLSAGLGFVSSSYDSPGIADGSIMVGVLGVGALIPLGENVSLRLDLDDYVYNMHWEFDGLQSQDQMQQDIVAAVGLTFHTGR
jgi:hypothetical protein